MPVLHNVLPVNFENYASVHNARPLVKSVVVLFLNFYLGYGRAVMRRTWDSALAFQPCAYLVQRAFGAGKIERIFCVSEFLDLNHCLRAYAGYGLQVIPFCYCTVGVLYPLVNALGYNFTYAVYLFPACHNAA